MCRANIVLPEIAGLVIISHFLTLKQILNIKYSCIITGNDYGDQTLVYGDANEPGRFDSEHLIFSGVNSLYEGVTICYPNPCILPGKTVPEVNRLDSQ